MRPIKFRGKSKKNGEWVYGSLVSIEDTHYIVPLETKTVCICERLHIHWDDFILVDSETVGQFTGLHDKNGKEIYEFDKVKFYDKLTDKRFKGVVKYNDGSFCIVSEFITHYRFIDYGMEVIGNIYEDGDNGI